MATDGEFLPPERVNADGILVLEGDKYIRKQKDTIQNEWTFTLDPSQRPKQLLINRGMSGGKERFSYLIYKIEGDTLTTKSGSRSFPTDFSLDTDRGCYVTVYERSGG
jgi:uncharacterized protein (TIGR03067 family)